MKPKLTITKDFTDRFNEIVKRFRHDEVLVGIPEQKSDRTAKDAKEQIGNAALLAINEFGSAANNIPARPVMAIGIRNAAKDIAEQFKLAAINSLKEGFSALDQYYERAGIIASNSVKKTINAQEGILPPSEATIATRKSQGFQGTKALIVTGQMRNAITYVVRNKAG